MDTDMATLLRALRVLADRLNDYAYFHEGQGHKELRAACDNLVDVADELLDTLEKTE